MDRDAVVTVYQESGATGRCCYADIETARKSIEAAVVEADKRMRCGIEMEKSVFLEQYKDRPEVIRKAKFFAVRIRDDSGKWVMEQHVKIYDDRKGVYRFEESHSQEVRKKNVVDDCAFDLAQIISKECSKTMLPQLSATAVAAGPTKS